MDKPDVSRFHFLATGITVSPTDAGSVRFAGVAYSGDRIQDHWAWPDGVVFDLDTTEIPGVLPVLQGHCDSCRLGVAPTASIENGAFTVEGEIFADLSDDARQVAEFAKRGFPFQMSPYIIPQSIEEVSRGMTVQVNGRTFDGPVVVFRNSRIREISVVTSGADHQTSMSVFSASPNQRATPMNDDRIRELEAALAAEQTKFAAQDEKSKALQAELDGLKAQIEADKKAQRLASVKELFSALGRSTADEAAMRPYVEMPDDAYAAVTADLTAAAKAKGSSLFSSQANAGASGQQPPVIDVTAIYAARRPS